jgi:RNA recognition motif-containing protein
MPSTEEANAAISGLNQKEIQGRPLSVSVAREKEGQSNNRSSFSRPGNKRFS